MNTCTAQSSTSMLTNMMSTIVIMAPMNHRVVMSTGIGTNH